MALATLSIDLEARLATFEKQMEKAARIAEKNAQDTRAAWQRAGAGVAAIGASVAGLFAGISLVDAFKGHVEFIDSLNDMQDATGASIEKLSGLADLAQRTGHSVDSATSLVVKMNAALNDTDPNSTASRAIAAIGLSADELRKMDPVDAVSAVAKALANYADDGAKARLVQELFGKSARELAPLIKDLAEAGQLNAKFTAEQAAEADKFNKALADMQTNSANAARTIVADMLPALNRFFVELKAGREAFGGTFAAIFKLGTEAPGPALDGLQKYQAKVAELQKEIAGLEADGKNGSRDGVLGRFMGGLNDGRLAERRKDLEEAQKYLTYYQKVLGITDGKAGAGRGLVNPTGDLPSVGDLPGKTKADKPDKEKIDEAQRALAQYVETQSHELAQAQELTEVQKALNFLKTLGTTGEIEQVRELVLGRAQKIQQLKDEAEIEKGIADYKRQQYQIQKGLDDQLEQFSGRVEDARKRALTARLAARLDGGEEFSKEELDNIVRGIGGLEKPKAEISELDQFAQQAGRNIQDTLGQTMYATLSGQWSSLGDLWAQTVLKMVAEASAAQLGKLLLGDFGKTGSVGGLVGDGLKWLGGLFADGGAFGPGGQIRAFATGDVFNSPTMFGYGGGQMGVLGEAGPEAIMPLKRGPDGKLGIVSRGAGGGRVVQLSYAPVFQVDSRSDRAGILSDTQSLIAQSQREMLAMLKGKGVIA